MKKVILVSILIFSCVALLDAQRGIPKNNWSLYLGWTGAVDTNIDFDDFFNQDFTLTAWVMPQYTQSYAGPIFSNNGDGIFLAGQGDYIWGTGGHKKTKSNGDKYTSQGEPVFFIQVGKQKVTYLLPQFKGNYWAHVAIVRSQNKLRLFINGKHMYPNVMKNGDVVKANSPEITIDEIDELLPKGKLRFGRSDYSRGDHPDKIKITKESNRYDIRHYQFYGLIDDVGLFDQALTGDQVKVLKNKSKRLSGFEKHLKAGWIFDKKEGNKAFPNKLQQSWAKEGRLYTLPVSGNRNNFKDYKSFNNFLVIGETSVSLKLPFPKNEVWKVVQGYNSKGGSHYGYAAFCYDFTPAQKNASYAAVYAAAAGKVVSYKMSEKQPPANSKNETNYIKIFLNPGEFLLYLHMAHQSQNSLIKGGTYDAGKQVYSFPAGSGPAIPSEGFMAKIGPSGKHLHISATSEVSYGPTFPVAFTNYEVSDDEGKTWKQVVRGHPRYKQWVRRKQ